MTPDAALDRMLLAIPALDAGPRLARLLPTLRVPGDRVVVLDGGSRDDTEAVCRARGVAVHPLGAAPTAARACNVAARLGLARGAEFLLFVGDGILFATDVARELAGAMTADARLGAAAPSLLVRNEPSGAELTAYRSAWDLAAVRFGRDHGEPNGRAGRLEADYCALACVLLRLPALAEVGFLDERFASSCADADLGFRLRVAGYGSCSLTGSQAVLTTGEPDAPSAAERALFAGKHLGYGVRYRRNSHPDVSSWGIVSRYLHPGLARAGLLHPDRRELFFSHPGPMPYDYLYTVWETTRLPDRWLALKDSYRAIFTASTWNRDVFESAGFRNVHHAPLGVETDIFHPDGLVERLYGEKTFLWFSHNQYRKALDVLLDTWRDLRRIKAGARLVVMGEGVLAAMRHAPASVRHWKNFIVADYPEEGISLWEMVGAITDRELATLYRSVDVVVSNSRSEGFGFVIGEAMACGCLTVFPGYAASREFAFEGALMIRGREVPARYADRGFDDVGNWWEPDRDHLLARLVEAAEMDDGARAELTKAGVLAIRQRFTWRHTVFGLRAGLVRHQDQKTVRPAAGKTARAPDRHRLLRHSGGPLAQPRPARSGASPVPALSRAWQANRDRAVYLWREFATARYESGAAAAAGMMGRRAMDALARRVRALAARIGTPRR